MVVVLPALCAFTQTNPEATYDLLQHYTCFPRVGFFPNLLPSFSLVAVQRQLALPMCSRAETVTCLDCWMDQMPGERVAPAEKEEDEPRQTSERTICTFPLQILIRNI